MPDLVRVAIQVVVDVIGAVWSAWDSRGGIEQRVDMDVGFVEEVDWLDDESTLGMILSYVRTEEMCCRNNDAVRLSLFGFRDK
jgi:hypothetical protein